MVVVVVVVVSVIVLVEVGTVHNVNYESNITWLLEGQGEGAVETEAEGY